MTLSNTISIGRILAPIRKRVEDLNKASAHTALFLEYISQNLYDWLSAQITKDNDAAEAAVAFVDTLP